MQNDLISRQEAIDAVCRCGVNNERNGKLMITMAQTKQSIVDLLDDLPPVQPEPKMGRWILSGGYWRCSECKEKALLTFDKSKGGCREYEPVRSKYCPNCGAKMEEGE